MCTANRTGALVQDLSKLWTGALWALGQLLSSVRCEATSIYGLGKVSRLSQRAARLPGR